MKLQRYIGLFLFTVFMIQSSWIFAFETDQYNLPPEPLADIGDELTDYVDQNISKAIYKINSEIKIRRYCLEKQQENKEKIKCDSIEKEQKRLEFLRSNDAVALEIYKLLGTGIPPFTSSGSWIESHRFKSQPSRYRTGYFKSIYLMMPIDYIGIGSTVNVYGAQFGTDKIAHLFQQGYDYYKIYRESSEKGDASETAVEKAVKWGQKTEHGFFGTLISGVYSNADLAANYVGMKFYQGLTKDLKVGNDTQAPILLLKNGLWAFNENVNLREHLMKPFISNHLNEALNPSIYTKNFGLRSSIRRSVRKRSCKQWLINYPNLTREDFNKISQAMISWHGENYGFTDSENFITIGNTCFNNEEVSDKQSD